MLVALYVGDHRADGFRDRLGWWLTRQVQRGEFRRVTHVEAILAERPDGRHLIASSSLRDGGVRIKAATLDPAHWLIADVPAWDADAAREWFAQHIGEPYDWRGALATVLPGKNASRRWFCNEAVGAAVGLRSPAAFGPAQFAAICFTFGRDVTAEFFTERA